MRKHIKTTGATLLTAAVAAGCLLTGAGPASALTLDGPHAASAQSPAPTVKDLVAVRDASTGDTTVTGIGRADSAVLIRWASGANFIAMTGSDGSFSDTRKAGLPIDATVSVRSTVSEAWQPVAIVEGEPTSPVVAEPNPGQTDPGFTAPVVAQPGQGAVDPGFTAPGAPQAPTVRDARAVYDARTDTTTVTGTTVADSSASIRWPGWIGSIVRTAQDGTFSDSRKGKFTTISVRAPFGGAWQTVPVTQHR